MTAPFTPEQEARLRELIADEVAKASSPAQEARIREIAGDLFAQIMTTGRR